MIALKIDVDTHEGMARGVPPLLDALAQARVPASFFLALGPDRSGLAALQALRSPRFVIKMVSTNAASLYGWRTMLSGTLLPARPVASAFPALVRRIEAEGHETAVHAWDHRAWQDDLDSFKPRRIRAHYRRAVAAYRALTGHDPAGEGAPAWMTTPTSLRIQDEFPFRYASDLRGGPPCRLRVDGALLRLPQLPATGACIEELVGAGIHDRDRLVDALIADVRGSRLPLRVVTLHAEVEGGPYLDVLRQLLPRLRDLGEIVTMATAAQRLATTDLPVRDWGRAKIRGRAFPVTVSRAG